MSEPIPNPDNNHKLHFIYDLDKAADVIIATISGEMKEKYNWEDVHLILELMDEYLETTGVKLKEGEQAPISNYPVDIDEDAMRYYIIKNAVECDLIIEPEELDEILDAELLYLEMNGQLGDLGEHLN